MSASEFFAVKIPETSRCSVVPFSVITFDGAFDTTLSVRLPYLFPPDVQSIALLFLPSPVLLC